MQVRCGQKVIRRPGRQHDNHADPNPSESLTAQQTGKEIGLMEYENPFGAGLIILAR